MTLKSLLKPIILALTLLPMLGSCSLFDSRPKTMTIEYDEEVKLHDGEMIWVHITRHYLLVGGGALGDPGAFEKNYMPKEVEISWDTGFEGVGRKSVYFDNLSVIDKLNDNWYLFGGTVVPSSNKYDKSVSASEVGSKVGRNAYLVVINQKGNYVSVSREALNDIKQTNILNPLGIKDWGSVPQALDGKKLAWSEKIILQSYQSENRQFVHEGFDASKVN